MEENSKPHRQDPRHAPLVLTPDFCLIHQVKRSKVTCKRVISHHSVCVFETDMSCFDLIGERSRVIVVCASLPHLCSSEESHFTCQSNGCITVTWEKTGKRDERPDRKMLVPWLTQGESFVFSNLRSHVWHNTSWSNYDLKPKEDKEGGRFLPLDYREWMKATKFTQRAMHRAQYSAAYCTSLIVPHNEWMITLSLLLNDEAAVFTGMFWSGLAVQVQRVHQHIVLYLYSARFFKISTKARALVTQ